jgi:hypothetical protein
MTSPPGITLTPEQFLGAKSAVRQVDALMRRCIAEGLTLDVTLGARSVCMTAIAAARNIEACRVEGRWRSAHIGHSPSITGTLLLAPLLFWIERMRFAPVALTMLGRDTRSIADLVMRLYYIAALRRQTFRFIDPGTDGGVRRLSRDLARTYLWLARANIDDEVLRASNAMERVLAEVHLPEITFTHPLLRAGSVDIQTAIDDTDAATRKRRLLQLRDRWIEEFQP